MARIPASFLRVLLGLAALRVAGCASAPNRDPNPGVPAPNASAGAHAFLEAPTRRVRSRRLEFPVELNLPDKEAWHLSDGPSWLVAAHPASKSLLAVRTWRADRLVRRSECEAQARLARPSLPVVRDDAVLERRALRAPADFDTELVVGVEPSAPGLSGYALVFGASPGRCYAALFSTAVSGAHAEEEVAARLGLAVDRILSGIRLRSVDERGVRRRLIYTPRAPRTQDKTDKSEPQE